MPGLDLGQPGRADQPLVAEADMYGVDRALEVALRIPDERGSVLV